MLVWAGIGIVVGVQVATFLYTLRRLDSLQMLLLKSKRELRGLWESSSADNMSATVR